MAGNNRSCFINIGGFFRLFCFPDRRIAAIRIQIKNRCAFLLASPDISLTYRLAWLAAAYSALALPVYASENNNSNYVPGFYGDFGMALKQENGWYLDNFAIGYTAANADINSNSVLELPGIGYATETKIAGGHYALSIYPGVAYAENNYTKGNSKQQSSRVGAGDIYAIPAQLSWQLGAVSVLAFEGISIPVGSYRKNRDLNTGLNFWTFDSNISVTWLPDDGNYDFSLNLGYMVNTENTATHYRTGDELHLDYMAGYYLTQKLSLGITGTYYKQLIPDSGRGVTVTAVQGESSSIGPVLMYNVKLDGRDVNFSAKWLHEYSVNNHAPGDYAIVRTTFSF